MQIDYFRKQYSLLAEEIRNRKLLFEKFEYLVRETFCATFSDNKTSNGIVFATLRSYLANLFLEENPKPFEKLFFKKLPDLLQKYPDAQIDIWDFLTEFGKENTAQLILSKCQVYNEFTGGFTNGIFNYSNFNSDSFEIFYLPTLSTFNFADRIQSNLPPEKIRAYFLRAFEASENVPNSEIDNFLGAFFEGFPKAEFTHRLDVLKLAETPKGKNTARQFIYDFIQLEQGAMKKRKSKNIQYALLLHKAFKGFQLKLTQEGDYDVKDLENSTKNIKDLNIKFKTEE